MQYCLLDLRSLSLQLVADENTGVSESISDGATRGQAQCRRKHCSSVNRS
jgi:hypothetical protein